MGYIPPALAAFFPDEADNPVVFVFLLILVLLFILAPVMMVFANGFGDSGKKSGTRVGAVPAKKPATTKPKARKFD